MSGLFEWNVFGIHPPNRLVLKLLRTYPLRITYLNHIYSLHHHRTVILPLIREWTANNLNTNNYCHCRNKIPNREYQHRLLLVVNRELKRTKANRSWANHNAGESILTGFFLFGSLIIIDDVVYNQAMGPGATLDKRRPDLRDEMGYIAPPNRKLPPVPGSNYNTCDRIKRGTVISKEMVFFILSLSCHASRSTVIFVGSTVLVAHLEISVFLVILGSGFWFPSLFSL